MKQKIIAFLTLFACSVSFAADVFLVKDKTPKSVIVIEDEQNVTAKKAAEELRIVEEMPTVLFRKGFQRVPGIDFFTMILKILITI